MDHRVLSQYLKYQLGVQDCDLLEIDPNRSYLENPTRVYVYYKDTRYRTLHGYIVGSHVTIVYDPSNSLSIEDREWRMDFLRYFMNNAILDILGGSLLFFILDGVNRLRSMAASLWNIFNC